VCHEVGDEAQVARVDADAVRAKHRLRLAHDRRARGLRQQIHHETGGSSALGERSGQQRISAVMGPPEPDPGDMTPLKSPD
jgi:hypothetical protein